jgi:hypothetical protein
MKRHNDVDKGNVKKQHQQIRGQKFRI